MKPSALFALSATLALPVLVPPAVHAQPAEGAFPARALRFLVPFAPGGGNDFIARTLAHFSRPPDRQDGAVRQQPLAMDVIFRENIPPRLA